MNKPEIDSEPPADQPKTDQEVTTLILTSEPSAVPCTSAGPRCSSPSKSFHGSDDEIPPPCKKKKTECMVDYITCPQCRAEHKLASPIGIDGFLTNFVIERQLKEQSSSSASLNNLTCNGCDGSKPVVAGCFDCAEYLCDYCFTAHKTLKRFTRHNVKELADLDKESIMPCKSRRRYVCPQHPVESVQLYCQICDTVVCNKCIISCVHSGHKLSEIDSQTRKNVQKQLLSLLTKVDEDIKIQVKNLEYVKKVEKATSDMFTDVQQKISDTFNAYASALEKRRKELLDDSESRCSQKMKVLWSERDSLERIIADMTTTQNFTEQTKECANDEEFLLFASQALPRLKKLKSWEWSNREVEKIEHYTLTFEESDLTVDLISGASRLDTNQVPYKVDFQGFTNSAELGEQHNFTIHISQGKSCHPWTIIETPEVSFEHVRSRTHEVADIYIERTDEEFKKSPSFDSMDNEKKWEITNTWMITYTPYCGGRHKLTIEIEGKSKVVKDITVQGVPSIGSAVVAGPDNYCYSFRGGTVTNNNIFSGCLSVCELYVNTTKEFSWGKNGKYEVQLKQGVQNMTMHSAHGSCQSYKFVRNRF